MRVEEVHKLIQSLSELQLDLFYVIVDSIMCIDHLRSR